jgi:NADPH:quinone reductase-like Zn-dependent oxidoreductase
LRSPSPSIFASRWASRLPPGQPIPQTAHRDKGAQGRAGWPPHPPTLAALGRAALSRGVRLTAFTLGGGLAKRTTAQIRALYADLAVKLRDGVLKAPVEATYPIENIKQALAHAQRGGRSGKVLVLPNGAL